MGLFGKGPLFFLTTCTLTSSGIDSSYVQCLTDFKKQHLMNFAQVCLVPPAGHWSGELLVGRPASCRFLYIVPDVLTLPIQPRGFIFTECVPFTMSGVCMVLGVGLCLVTYFWKEKFRDKFAHVFMMIMVWGCVYNAWLKVWSFFFFTLRKKKSLSLKAAGNFRMWHEKCFRRPFLCK